MAYGHAERNLALLRQLEAETRQLLESLDRLDPEQSAWLQEVTRPHGPVLPAPGGPMISIEGTVVALGDLIGEGKIGHIGLCEASPGAIRPAHAMHPVIAV
jgi:aryl-alcohol dehydrogenase-like predicted oxidoreductase